MNRIPRLNVLYIDYRLSLLTSRALVNVRSAFTLYIIILYRHQSIGRRSPARYSSSTITHNIIIPILKRQNFSRTIRCRQRFRDQLITSAAPTIRLFPSAVAVVRRWKSNRYVNITHSSSSFHPLPSPPPYSPPHVIVLLFFSSFDSSCGSWITLTLLTSQTLQTVVRCLLFPV